MRELNVYPPKDRKYAGAVQRLQFDATGRELVAWIEDPEDAADFYPGATRGLRVFDLGTAAVRSLADDWFDAFSEFSSQPVVSPDLSVMAAELDFEDDNQFISLVNLRDSDQNSSDLPAPPAGLGAFAFTPDGNELIAARNRVIRDKAAPDVTRFIVSAFTDPPTEFRDEVNPLTNLPHRVPVRDMRWQPAVRLPRGESACTVGLSANGRLAVVGTVHCSLYVVDLKRKKVTASLPWEGRKLRHIPVRVAFDPAAKWVVMLAGGRLFARPLKTGKAWHTPEKLGLVRDFAFHPSGRTLCAVREDGQALYLDPTTGTVRESFRWSKKPLRSVCFAPDGLTCAAGSEKGRVVLWDVDV